MAKSTPAARARGVLIGLLVLILGMGGLLYYGVSSERAQWAPQLALDLEGGTQMVLSPQVDGGGEVDSEQLEQAVEIIRQRVDGTGVAEAEIATQGASNVVVALPGVPDEETRELIQASADMEFRPVIEAELDPEYVDQLVQEQNEEEAGNGDAEEDAPANGDAEATEEAAAADEDSVTEEEGAAEEGEAAPDEGDAAENGQARPEDFEEPTDEPTDGSDRNWVTQELAAEFANYECSRDMDLAEREASEDDEPLVTCDPESGWKYILGPVEVPGTNISDASFGMEQSPTGNPTGRWAVNIVFDSEGTDRFAETTTRLNGLSGAQNQFAIVLDGHVISAPQTRAAITDGRPQITGEFTEDEARNLSEQLRYGSLPISFEIESEEQISATLGADQLRMGLLAGIIGLVLVAGYALFQYRALGIVAIASLVVAGLITWWAISLLGWLEGYRLSLAGIAGLIVSIGLTADSFIVYFERVKDELREGRSLPGAVERGWQRARRTILASKIVNIIAAVVLYLVAVGNVRGFAFTLGLTALIDILLVFMFTHPFMQLLARKKFFAAGRRFSGLSEKALGVDVLYRGAGRFARTKVVTPALAEAGTIGRSAADIEDAGPGTGQEAEGLTDADPADDPVTPVRRRTDTGADETAGDDTAGNETPDGTPPAETQRADAPASSPSRASGETAGTDAVAIEDGGEDDEPDWASMTIAERRRAREKRAAAKRASASSSRTASNRTAENTAADQGPRSSDAEDDPATGEAENGEANGSGAGPGSSEDTEGGQR